MPITEKIYSGAGAGAPPSSSKLRHPDADEFVVSMTT
jgi:hypothetical protein